MDTSLIIFFILAGIALLSSLCVVLANNPVRSALSLVLNLFTVAIIYFTLRAQLIGISQIMVYVGAIMVLFIFVIMLLNLSAPSNYRKRTDIKSYLATVAGLVIFGVILTQVILPLKHIQIPLAPDHYGTPHSIGYSLFSQYVLSFEIISILLLVGVVGSILLAKRRF